MSSSPSSTPGGEDEVRRAVMVERETTDEILEHKNNDLDHIQGATTVLDVESANRQQEENQEEQTAHKYEGLAKFSASLACLGLMAFTIYWVCSYVRVSV